MSTELSLPLHLVFPDLIIDTSLAIKKFSTLNQIKILDQLKHSLLTHFSPFSLTKPVETILPSKIASKILTSKKKKNLT
jgi:hypothetical protein